ncbi:MULTISPECIES: hypothetical protein [Xanthomonas]|uniref:hypothetical protein n=1 Tax=Xanthomonas TaxID=338 RepID=UPI000938685C|nr:MULTISPECIES: hypothetical protein [Xanthomonas]APP86985.1 hypothetical protein BI317_13845 [Xanthomonas hortorum pv. gardneri]MCC5051272.1 hypothetical protein [Xanthomonas campestris pv. aberrans]MCE4307916.1 hypothetical protein [Xanthomonas hortorum pv. vitians]MCE4338460.1 hypothetical protein [Xanthomonas hortorum pv. vitians]MCE4507461.1 hypothetical protein [Xanthomonas hortorum pv. vitians]
MFNLESFKSLRKKQLCKNSKFCRELSRDDQYVALAMGFFLARNPEGSPEQAEAFWRCYKRQHHLITLIHAIYPHQITLQPSTPKAHKRIYRHFVRYSIKVATEKLKRNWYQGVPIDTSIDLASTCSWLEHVLDLKGDEVFNFLWDIDHTAQIKSTAD